MFTEMPKLYETEEQFAQRLVTSTDCSTADAKAYARQLYLGWQIDALGLDQHMFQEELRDILRRLLSGK